MKKTIVLLILLIMSTNTLALHNLENPDAIGTPIVDESEVGKVPTNNGNLQKGTNDQYGSVIDNPPPDEDSWWDKTTDTVGDWWADE